MNERTTEPSVIAIIILPIKNAHDVWYGEASWSRGTLVRNGIEV